MNNTFTLTRIHYYHSRLTLTFADGRKLQFNAPESVYGWGNEEVEVTIKEIEAHDPDSE